MNQANRAMFEFTLAKHYGRFYANIKTASQAAYYMTLQLCKGWIFIGEGDNSRDHPLKRTCEDLGIEFTDKGVYDYLNAPEEETES
jgi:hypothetical protein